MLARRRPMAGQWEEEQHLDDLIERRRMERSSLKLDVVQKVPELVVNKRMSRGEKGNDTKEKKKVPGWPIEETKERPNIAVKEDTEEMKNGEVQTRVRWIHAGRIWLKEWKRKSWTSAKLKRARAGRSTVEETPGNGEEYAETRDKKH